ncbi:MAG: cell surface protein, partial [Armatimonadetes bacterium]|nr:cell surface protein [Akkermansiaceae bacterium]
MRRIFTALLLASLCATAYDDTSAFGKARTVLEVNCVECHTVEKAKGGLVMESLAQLKTGGDSGTALVVGNTKESGIYMRVVLAADDDDRMPPKKHGPALPAEDIEVLKNWIEAGADWPEGETLQ